MDAIVGVWLSSLLGAGAFSTMGYILGQRGVSIPLLKLDPLPSAPAATAPSPSPSPTALSVPTPTGDRPTIDLTEPDEHEPTGETKVHAAPQEIAAAELEHSRITAPPPPPTPTPTGGVASLVDDEDDERSTAARRRKTVPKMAAVTAEASAEASAEIDAARRELQAVMAELEGTKSELAVALDRVKESTQTARAAEATRADLERQLEVIRAEHRREVVARAAAEQKMSELGDRLARASEEAGSLRHKLAGSERQMKVLSARPPPVDHGRRIELDEMDDLRGKLRELSEKLARSSAAPPAPAPPKVTPPPAKAPAVTSPQEKEELGKLRDENVRLTKENRSLRARALGVSQDAPARSASDIDVDVYRTLVDRLAGLGGIRGAVLADEVGSLLAGSGDLAEGLAAFGAYIRDASSRTERLLPIEPAVEIDLRDRSGTRLLTQVVTAGSSALSLVLLGGTGDAIETARKLVQEKLRTP